MLVMDRTQGIGGSDAKHLFNLEPYGCERKLWYQKRGTEPDFVPHKAIFDRGHILEDIVAKMYTEQTGFKVRRVNRTLVHHNYDYLIGHIDRQIMNKEGETGVLECKTMGYYAFKKLKTEGLSDDYILQMQHYLAVTGYTWGAFAILWADGWEFLTFEVQRDDELIQQIIDKASIFWRKVENGQAPDRLDVKDKRCRSCEFRNKCQEALLLEYAKAFDDDKEEDVCELTDDFNELLEEYKDAKQIADEANEYLEEIKDKIKSKVGDKQVLKNDYAKIIYKPIQSKRLNTQALKKDMPEIYEKYGKITVSKQLKIYLKGEI
jgi:predicted phage-related endonuclease